MAQFCDLCISRTNENIYKTIELASKLGYRKVAINYVHEEKEGQGSKKSKEKGPPVMKPEMLVQVKKPSLKKSDDVEILSRLTMMFSDASQVVRLQRDETIQRYDILAVRPTTEKLFHLACTQLEVDIISLDLTERLPFFFKRQSIGPAIERGVVFEVCYSPMIRDSTARKNIISSVQSLATVSKGKHLILSSDCEKVLELRGPYDVANIATLFGLSEAQAKATVSTSCLHAIMHGKARKTAKCAMSVQLVSTLPAEEQWKARLLQQSIAGEETSDQPMGVEEISADVSLSTTAAAAASTSATTVVVEHKKLAEKRNNADNKAADKLSKGDSSPANKRQKLVQASS